MLDDAEHSQSKPVVCAANDPWARMTLPPDSSQNAWLISYIDILLLLTTLLVVLLAQQKHTPDQQTRATQTTQVADLRQTSTPPPSPTLSTRPSVVPDHPHQILETPPISRLLPDKRSQPAAATTPAVPPPQAPQTEPPSHAPVRATPAGDRAAAQVAVMPEQQPEAASSPVRWDLPDDLKEQVDMTHEAQYIRLEVKDTLLFESASAELKAQATTLLQNLVSMLQHHTGHISVEGHSDDIPIATARYPSNWELSAARASTVARYLILHGIAADRVQAVGYADTRPRSANDSSAGRARNRRVSLVIYHINHTP